MSQYSVKNALLLATSALATEALIGTGYAVWSHANSYFDTLREAFHYVAQPEALVLAAAAAIVFGAGGEVYNQYHRTLNQEDLRRQRPQPDAPRQ